MPRSTAWRIGVLAACLLGQWWWIYNMYALGNTYLADPLTGATQRDVLGPRLSPVVSAR